MTLCRNVPVSARIRIHRYFSGILLYLYAENIKSTKSSFILYQNSRKELFYVILSVCPGRALL